MKYQCPQCKCTDRIDIAIHTYARLVQLDSDEVETDADQADQQSHDWDADSYARCGACDYYGKMSTFEAKEEPKIGGWRVEGRGDEFAIVDEDDVTVARVPYTHETGAEPLDTAEGRRARLLSAAPELLEAVEAVMNWWTRTIDDGEEMPADIFDGAFAAIKKARNE